MMQEAAKPWPKDPAVEYLRARIRELENVNGRLRARVENLEDAARMTLTDKALKHLREWAQTEEEIGSELGGGAALTMLLRFYKRVKKAAEQ